MRIASYPFICIGIFTGFIFGCSAPQADTTGNPPVSLQSSNCGPCDFMAPLIDVIKTHGRDEAFLSEMSSHLSKTQSEDSFQALYPIGLEVKGFCSQPKTENLIRVATGYLTEFDAIAGQLQSCSNSCKITINEAEYCTADQKLSAHRKTSAYMSQASMNASALLSLAAQSNRSVSEHLYYEVSPAASTIQEHLAMQMQWILTGEQQNNNAAEISIALRDLGESGGALQALSWAKLGGENTRRHGETLARVNKHVSRLKDEIHLAMTRARILDPSEKLSFGLELISASADLASVSYSVAALQNQRGPSGPITESNANNYGAENPLNIQDAIDCFNKISIETSILEEFNDQISTDLEECRSFDVCTSSNLQMIPGRLNDALDAMIESEDKDKKLLYAVRKHICPL